MAKSILPKTTKFTCCSAKLEAVRNAASMQSAEHNRMCLLRVSVTFVVVVCSGNGKLASTCAIIGFIVMMSLDVGLA